MRYTINIGLFLIFTLAAATAGAQLLQPYNITEPANNVTITLEGDTGTKLSFKWTNADLMKPGTQVIYTLQFDTAGSDVTQPPIVIGSTCCGNIFKDTTAGVSYRAIAKEINSFFETRYKKSFIRGESITLEWVVFANATAPNSTYDSKATVSKQRITFIRGQFNTEYVPVKLVIPLDNSSFFVEDNASVKLKFQWTKAYCPNGCGAPQYQIMFDSMGGDFSNPLYFFTIPQSPFDTIFDLRQDILAQMMYDDGVPINTPKTYKWTVSTVGNNQEVLAPPVRVSLLRGLMRYEHVPFNTITPVDNAIYKLEINTNDSVVFTWHRTHSGFPDAASYIIAFDTAKAQPDFTKPLFSFKTPVGDSLFTMRYGQLRDSADKYFGIHWTAAQMKWTVIADIIGYKFMSEDTNDMRLVRGFFKSVKETGAPALQLYPNPASTSITLGGMDITTVSIKDMSGREALKVDEFTGSVNVSLLAPGIYYISAVDKAGIESKPLRFIKE